MFNWVIGLVTRGATDTEENIDSSTDQHVNIQIELKAQLEKLKHEKFPGGFFKPVDVLETVDANVNGQWESRLQQISQDKNEKHIVLIPYCLKDSHWTGILIEFQGTREIQQVEFIDPVLNSEFAPTEIQEEFNKLYPGVTLSSKKLKSHNDPTQSKELTIDNLLKRVEELQSTNVAYHQVTTIKSETFDNQQKLTSSSNNDTPNQQGNPSYFFQPQQTVDTDKETSINIGVLDFSLQLPRTEQHIRQYEKSEEEIQSNDEEEVHDIPTTPKITIAVNPLPKPQLFSSSTSDESHSCETIENSKVGGSNVDLRQDEDMVTKETVINLYSDFSSMPSCLEKTVTGLIYLLSLKFIDQPITPEDNIIIPNSIETEIMQECERLNEQLKIEESTSSKIRDMVKEVIVNVKNQNWKYAFNTLETILKLMKPLNIQELFRLVEKVNDAAALIKGKDVVLLLGDTGTGKSTTIHFLGGSKFKKVTVNGLPHLYPYEVKNPDLKKVTTSPFLRSETRYIAPVTIRPEDVIGYTGSSFVLCDSPGFGDTSGPEVDIANGVGIIRAINKCKSVKIVVLISAMSIGDKLTGVKDLAHTLIGFIPDIKDRIKAFSYLFTKFSLEEKNKIIALLNDAQKQMTEEEKLDSNFGMLLKHMCRKTRDVVRIVDPINGDPLQILDDLEDSLGINNPDEVFRFSISGKSKAVVHEQIRIDQLNIMSATKRFDYLFIKYKLDQIKDLNKILNLEHIQQIYNDCVEYIRTHLSEEYKEATEAMNRCLYNLTSLSHEDISKYQICIDHAKLAENLKENHFEEQFIHSVAFVQNLDQQMDVMFSELKEKEINNPSVKISLDNMKLILNSFSDTNPTAYKSICQTFSETLISVIESFERSVQLNHFDQSASDMTKVYEALAVLHDHLDHADMEQKYNWMKEYLRSYFKDSARKINHVFQQAKLSKNDVDGLNNCICTLGNASNIRELHDHIPRAEIEEEHENLLLKIVNYFKEIMKRIEQELNNKKGFHTLGQFLEELDSIRTITVIEVKTSQFQFTIIEKILGYLREAKSDAQQELNTLFKREGKVNYDKLTKCLLNLNDAKWIENYRPGEYVEVMNDVKEPLIQHITDLKISVMTVPLDLENYDNIESAYKIVSEIKGMKPLKEFVPEISQHLDEVISWFQNEINKVCVFIDESFSLEEWKKEKKVIDFGTAEKAFHYLDTCKTSRVSNSIEFFSVRNNLEAFMRFYSDFLYNEIESSFLTITRIEQGNNNNYNNELSEKARILLNRLVEVSDIKTTYCRVFSFFSNKILVEQWSHKLIDYGTELENEMKTLSITKQNSALENKLHTVDALRILDTYLVDKIFTKIYRAYKLELILKTGNAVTKVLEAMREQDYVVVAREMASFKIAGDAGLHFFEEAQQTLRRHLDGCMEDIKSQARMIGNNLAEEKIKIVVGNLKHIKEAKQFVSQYLNTPDDLDKCIENVKLTLETRLKRYLDGVNTLININSFSEAEEKLLVLQSARDALDDYCTPELITLIEQSGDHLKNVVLKEIVPKYEKMDISRYIVSPPADIFEKFRAARNAKTVYNEALEKIKEIILTKFREELDLAKKETPPNTNNSHFRKFESAVKYLPRDMKESLEVELEYCKKDIEQLIIDSESEFNDVISNEDPKAIREYLQPKNNSQKQKIDQRVTRRLVLSQTREVVVKIEQYLQQDDIKEALDLVRVLCGYKTELGDIVTDITQQCSIVRSLIKNKFEEAYVIFMRDFLQDLGTESMNNIIGTTEKSFIYLLELVKFQNVVKDESILNHMLPDDFIEKMKMFDKKISTYFVDLQDKYKNALTKMDFPSFTDVLDCMHKRDLLIMKMKRNIQLSTMNDDLLHNTKNSIFNLTEYSNMLRTVSEKLQKLKDDLIKQKIMNEDTIQSSAQRDEFYMKLNETLLILENAKIISKYDLQLDINEIQQACVKVIKTRLKEIFAKVDDFLKCFTQQSRLREEDYKIFNSYYGHLLSFRQEMKTMDWEINGKIDKIEKEIFDTIDIWLQKMSKESSLDNIAKSLINIKYVCINIPLLNIHINKRIDEALRNYKLEKKDSNFFSKLGTILNKDPSGVGASIVAEHSVFQGYALYLFNQKTQKHGIDYVLENLQGDFINKKKLRKRCAEFYDIRKTSENINNRFPKINEEFDTIHYEPGEDGDESDGLYKKLIKRYLAINVKSHALISEIKFIVGDIKQTPDKIQWDPFVREKIPKLLAHIFALYTLRDTTSYFEAEGAENRQRYLLMPHAAQVISILRMLGIGDEEEILKNNLVQIGTGEGKSIILGVIASLLALLGFDVSCVCYSEYLSQRDYKDFLPIFDALGVSQYIHYGTFNKLCEDMINRNGEIRHIIGEVISTNSSNAVKNSQRNERVKILLIDEVDVFFTKDFYGNIYTPSANLKHPTITSLINFIWEQRNSKLKLNQVTATSEYKACCAAFPKWDPLIFEAVKDLISDVTNFDCGDYTIDHDMIGYKEHDNIIFNVLYGYKTLFTYYHEHENGKITKKSLEDRISMRIKCGSFSYAEIPIQFKYIMGVTGTLETLSAPEKDVIKNKYKIEKNTYTPSVFGANNLLFKIKDDIRIENDDDYLNAIKREIDDRLVGKSGEKRAVLVFFESARKLQEFYDSKALEAMKESVNIFTEKRSSSEKETLIKAATRSGQVTLSTRAFGRGTDFVCYDHIVNANGGVHVIQTFLSEECSEEKQIKGRTARQGDNGSYSMVLLDRDLEKFLIQKEHIDDVLKGKEVPVDSPDAVDSKIRYETIYHFLDDKRNALFKTQYEANTQFVNRAKEKHMDTQKFLLDLYRRDMNLIKQFLVKENKGVDLVRHQSRTICLMDATGSMSHLLHKCKTTVGNMLECITMILRENQISEDSFQIQFVVYRNYSNDRDTILQISPWETKPDNLLAFLNGITVAGGLNNEAIEIGLWHANQENEREDITQVILIGDAPPNTKNEVKQKRSAHFGETYWTNTKFGQATYYEDELTKLATKKIPVHTFYVEERAKAIFSQIADRTGGRCNRLDINSLAGADQLTDLVSEVILTDVDPSGTGILVQQYREKFGKSYA